MWILAATSWASDPSAAAAVEGARCQLPDAPGLYERWDPARSWGTCALVSAVEQVAERVSLALPLADPLLVGDISRRGGGPMPGHSSHDRGVDVDIGLFMDDGRQPLGGFVPLRPSQLDVKSTWVLIRTAFDTGQVQFALLDQGHIDRLRAYALDELALDPNVVERMFPTTPERKGEFGVIRHAPSHRDHVHFRFVSAEVAALPQL
jgi:murein endopeptidase